MKKLSLKAIALQYNSRSHICNKCKIEVNTCLHGKHFTACNNNFIEGFIKGYKHYKKEIKEGQVEVDIRKAYIIRDCIVEAINNLKCKEDNFDETYFECNYSKEELKNLAKEFSEFIINYE